MELFEWFGVEFLGIVLGIFLVLFFIFRGILNWYFKINRRVDLLEQILQELKQMNNFKL